MAATRREVRERALGLLYEAEVKGVEPKALLAEELLQPEEFLVEILTGVTDRGNQIDEIIDQFAIDWKLDRMPAIDRSVLRLAVFELLAEPHVPTGAIINEAVDLASAYSTDGSGRFVNGLLSAVAAHVRPE